MNKILSSHNMWLALSDLSFVLVKNGTDKVELGILAKALQRDEGCL